MCILVVFALLKAGFVSVFFASLKTKRVEKSVDVLL